MLSLFWPLLPLVSALQLGRDGAGAGGYLALGSVQLDGALLPPICVGGGRQAAVAHLDLPGPAAASSWDADVRTRIVLEVGREGKERVQGAKAKEFCFAKQSFPNPNFPSLRFCLRQMQIFG